jgi:hypothetical protein
VRRRPFLQMNGNNGSRAALLPGVSVRSSRLPVTLRPGHDHIDFAAAAFGTDEPIAPVEHGRFGAVPRSHLGRPGLQLNDF